jgi:hypothetical protein
MSGKNYVRVSFVSKKFNQKQSIDLEPKYIKALHMVAGEERNQWLDTLTCDYIAKNGDVNLGAFVRTKIINALIESMDDEPKKSNTIDGFNAKFTAFDVLTDYMFGGDSKEALEYLKTL